MYFSTPSGMSRSIERSIQRHPEVLECTVDVSPKDLNIWSVTVLRSGTALDRGRWSRLIESTAREHGLSKSYTFETAVRSGSRP